MMKAQQVTSILFCKLIRCAKPVLLLFDKSALGNKMSSKADRFIDSNAYCSLLGENSVCLFLHERYTRIEVDLIQQIALECTGYDIHIFV